MNSRSIKCGMPKIHIFTTPRTNQKRKHACVHAGIFLRFDPLVGYTRIFRMPCKFISLHELIIPILFFFQLSKICHFLGQRPHKYLPTDDVFSDALLEFLIDAFERILPDCVSQELANDEYSRIINIYTGFTTYLKSYNKQS